LKLRKKELRIQREKHIALDATIHSRNAHVSTEIDLNSYKN